MRQQGCAAGPRRDAVQKEFIIAWTLNGEQSDSAGRSDTSNPGRRICTVQGEPEVAIRPCCNVIRRSIVDWDPEGGELACRCHFYDQVSALGEPEFAVSPRPNL